MKKQAFGRIGCMVLLIVLLAALASCSKEVTLEKIELEGYTQDFFVGDEFTTGENFAVYAVYSDGKREQISEGYTVKQETGMNMYTPGDYMVTVEYGGKKEVYTVYVNSDESTLKKLQIDPSGMKTAFKLGDAFDFSGIRITATYENKSGRKFDVVYTDEDLRMFDISVTDANGVVGENAYEEFGEHTVRVAYDDVSATCTVKVEGVRLDSVLSAIHVGKYGAQKVNSGSMYVEDSSQEKTNHTTYNYEFGDNYTHITEDADAGELSVYREYHFSIDPDTGLLVNATLENGSMITGNVYSVDRMQGVNIALWWYTEQVNGVEEAIERLYSVAVTDPNGDFQESVDEANKTYKFSFGRTMKLAVTSSSSDNYFETRVEFTLDENYAMRSAYIYQSIYPTGFTTDADGHTTINAGAQPEMASTMQCTQVCGERTAQNPYMQTNLIIQDFDLVYDGQVLPDDYVFTAKAGENVTIYVENISPASASLEYDRMEFTESEGYHVYRSGNEIRLTFLGHGSYRLDCFTQNVKKSIGMQLTGRAPEELNTQVYRPAFDGFVQTDNATIMIGSTLYFKAVPNKLANDAYTVTIDNEQEGITVQQTELNGESCYALVGATAGSYTVRMRSTSAQLITCVLKVTVVDAPDPEQLLTGSYRVTDNEDGVYQLQFTLDASSQPLTGTLTVVYTPKDGQAQTEVLRFTLDESTLSLMLENTQGDSLGIAIRVNAAGKFQLEDRYESTYELKAEE